MGQTETLAVLDFQTELIILGIHVKESVKVSFIGVLEGIANIAEQRGYQTISFDLPGHGERNDEDKRCDIWNGIHDLTVIGDYVFANW